MARRSVRVVAPNSTRWRWTLLASALILGVIGMHGLLSQPPPATPVMLSADAPRVEQDASLEGAVAAVASHDDGGEHLHEDAMPDCGWLAAICLALTVSFAGFALWRRWSVRGVRWQRPPALAMLGHVVTPFHQLTTLQRTAVLRC